ncbi:hypothetical protein K1T71_000920 [Dendrolimus kikuchii]|uniref:Uncharacterized protein n=1 Tax=Dendrolimus kikuchii TaxID=765133 RepID=A0ACC1DG37_9NEOP|nr:hypothetical protein K1T71_000920 [Dendrolimus kikuchii]
MLFCSRQILHQILKLEVTRHLSCSKNMRKRVAVCQMTSIADKKANLQVVSDLICDAAKENVEMIFFPEACDYICDNKKDIVAFSEPILGGQIVGKYRELAARHNVWLSMGGIHEKDDKNPSKMYNTHIIINNKGDIVQTYRKLHLFDVEIPEKRVRLKESDFSNPGDHIVTPVETPVGRVGLAICYDMRFPELSTALSILRAEILTFPSAFTQATGAAHWHILLRSRAIENQCYVIAAAQTGEHNPRRKSYGHALIVDPWGEVLADCGENGPCFKVAEICESKLADVRRNMPVFQHRRRDVYSLYPLSLRKDPIPEHSENVPEPMPEARPKTPDSGPTNVFGHVRVPEKCVFYKSKLSYAFVNLSSLDTLVGVTACIKRFAHNCLVSSHSRIVGPITVDERKKALLHWVRSLMEKVHKAQSCTVTIQDGPEAGRTVKHLHCHIMPRKKGDFLENDLIYLELAKHDQFKPGHPSKPARSLEEMQTEAEMLRSEMKKLIEEEQLLSR